MSLKMYVWHVHPSFLAVAQANSVEEARAAVLRSDLGESGDGSCPERDKAREFVLTNTPAIWYEVNAEFVLTDSAELREQEDYSQKLFKRVSQLEADLAAAREDVARMRKQIADHEEAEASVCPEDVGFVEFIGLLQRRIAGLVEAAAALRRFEKAPFCCVRGRDGAEWARLQLDLDAALASQPPAPGITDAERMDAVERLKLHVQYRDGTPASVERWAARNDAGMWTGLTAREAVDKALAALRAEQGGK